MEFINLISSALKEFFQFFSRFVLAGWPGGRSILNYTDWVDLLQIGQILHDLNITKMRLMTNSDQTKRVGIVGYGLEIVGYSPY